jgi:single-strand DNA-binding protein
MNKVILLGRMVKDPELKATTSGTSVCSFTVACDRKYTKQGEERKADFINCVAWQQSAESISKFFKKGQRIALEGRLEVRTWEGNDGKTNYATEVIVENWEFCQSKSETQANSYQSAENATEDNFAGDIDGFMPVDEDDLAF